jgi:hypothetical protein
MSGASGWIRAAKVEALAWRRERGELARGLSILVGG